MNFLTKAMICLIPSRHIRRKLTEPDWGSFYTSRLFRQILEIWETGRITPEWLNQLGFLSQSRSEWNQLPNDLWLIYASALRKIGETDKAAAVLQRYERRFGLKRIEFLLPLAVFAEELGMKNERIAESAKAFRALDRNRKAGLLAEVLGGKTVAVVGNGPSEIGTGHGTRIDSYDKVVRFNNYKTAGFESDYGTKTSVWVTSAGVDVNHQRDYSDFELTVIGPNLWHSFLSEEERLHVLETLAATDRAVTFDPLSQTELWEALENCPSYGLVCVWSILRQRLAPLTADDVYGFSFLQRVKQTYAEHYFKDGTAAERKERSHAHNFVTESDFIEKLFRKTA